MKKKGLVAMGLAGVMTIGCVCRCWLKILVKELTVGV